MLNTRLNEIEGFRSMKLFLGKADFKRAMSLSTFINICSSLKFNTDYDQTVAVLDSLWHSRIILQNFMRNAASIAVQTGCSTFHENKIRHKDGTYARLFRKRKPIKLGIWFCTVVGWTHTYPYSIRDKGPENKTNVDRAESNCRMFRDLRGSYDQKIDRKLVTFKSAFTLRCL